MGEAEPSAASHHTRPHQRAGTHVYPRVHADFMASHIEAPAGIGPGRRNEGELHRRAQLGSATASVGVRECAWPLSTPTDSVGHGWGAWVTLWSPAGEGRRARSWHSGEDTTCEMTRGSGNSHQIEPPAPPLEQGRGQPPPRTAPLPHATPHTGARPAPSGPALVSFSRNET